MLFIVCSVFHISGSGQSVFSVLLPVHGFRSPQIMASCLPSDVTKCNLDNIDIKAYIKTELLSGQLQWISDPSYITHRQTHASFMGILSGFFSYLSLRPTDVTSEFP